MSDVVGERDKPFILVVLGTALMFASIVYCLYMGQWFPTYQDLWKDVGLMWIPLVSMGWAYYFKAKSDEAVIATTLKIKNSKDNNTN